MRNRRADGERVNLFDMRLTYTLLLQYDKLNALFAHRLGENATRFLSSCGIYRTRGSQCHRDPHPSLSHRRNKGKREIKSHTHWQQLENLFTITLTTGNENSIRLVRLAFIKPANDRKFYRYLFIIKFAYYYDLFVPFSLSLRVTPVETERTQWQAASTKRRVICSIRFVFFFLFWFVVYRPFAWVFEAQGYRCMMSSYNLHIDWMFLIFVFDQFSKLN